MKIKRYDQFVSEEILNMPSWSSLTDIGKNGYVLPLLIWSSDIFEKTFKDGDYETTKPQSDVKLVKSWNLEDGLKGSYFQFVGQQRGVIFTHLNNITLEFADSKKDGYQLPQDLKQRCESLFQSFGLGTPIFATVVKDFEDGVKVVTTGSNWPLVTKLGIKRLGITTYKGFVRETKIPLYSDDTQTPESKEAIWKKLLQDESCEIVAWSQNNREELEITIQDGVPKYGSGIPVYFGDTEINQQVLDFASDSEDLQKYPKMKSLTKLLKLKSVV